MNTLTDPKDRAAVRTAFDQIAESHTAIATEKAQIKETLKALHDKYKIPKKTLRVAAKLYYKQTVVEFENETSEIKAFYKSITS